MAYYKLKKDKRGEYYWVLIAGNGEPVAKSSEAYSSKQGAMRSIEWNQQNGSTEKVVEEE